MRRIVACVAVAIAATAIASPAQAQERGCYEDYLRDGRTVEVFCDDGRPGRFRAVAHCTNGLGFWDQYGTIGRVRGEPSTAACTSLLGYPRVNSYHVDWL
ncbi:hypothetical protein OG205_37790 [Lentzea sp. NBC_00516]|uniref:hypothetical protein n=1 Tax=Lentzea sp. NBC_00516 TaxID=2903582 RepID=UPI002E7FF003|nr:hypothetical protein [Lentzea sp. NBC_00516]WUD23750.1 hypothetical protein OG205_37790 [Lentzea sp. NBC_00516]